MLDVIFMSLIKPVDRNQEHETSSEQEETVTQSVQLEQAGDPPSFCSLKIFFFIYLNC